MAATISTATVAPTFTQIPGQATDHSITVSVRSDTAVDLHFEFGVATTVYKAQTPAVTPTTDPFVPGTENTVHTQCQPAIAPNMWVEIDGSGLSKTTVRGKPRISSTSSCPPSWTMSASRSTESLELQRQ